MTVRATLLHCWKAPFDGVPRLAPVKAALDRILDAHDSMREKHAAIGKDSKLSAEGRKDAVRKHLAEATGRDLYRAGKAVEAMRAKLDKERAALVTLAPDKDGGAMREEMRTVLRGLDIGRRAAMLMAPNADANLLRAAIEAPDFLSGIDANIRAAVADRIVEMAHPGALAELERDAAAVEVLEAACRVTANAARTAGEFPTDGLFAEFLNEAVAPRTAAIDQEVERALAA